MVPVSRRLAFVPTAPTRRRRQLPLQRWLQSPRLKRLALYPYLVVVGIGLLLLGSLLLLRYGHRKQ